MTSNPTPPPGTNNCARFGVAYASATCATSVLFPSGFTPCDQCVMSGGAYYKYTCDARTNTISVAMCQNGCGSCGTATIFSVGQCKAIPGIAGFNKFLGLCSNYTESNNGNNGNNSNGCAVVKLGFAAGCTGQPAQKESASCGSCSGPTDAGVYLSFVCNKTSNTFSIKACLNSNCTSCATTQAFPSGVCTVVPQWIGTGMGSAVFAGLSSSCDDSFVNKTCATLTTGLSSGCLGVASGAPNVACNACVGNGLGQFVKTVCDMALNKFTVMLCNTSACGACGVSSTLTNGQCTLLPAFGVGYVKFSGLSQTCGSSKQGNTNGGGNGTNQQCVNVGIYPTALCNSSALGWPQQSAMCGQCMKQNSGSLKYNCDLSQSTLVISTCASTDCSGACTNTPFTSFGQCKSVVGYAFFTQFISFCGTQGATLVFPVSG